LFIKLSLVTQAGVTCCNEYKFPFSDDKYCNWSCPYSCYHIYRFV